MFGEQTRNIHPSLTVCNTTIEFLKYFFIFLIFVSLNIMFKAILLFYGKWRIILG